MKTDKNEKTIRFDKPESLAVEYLNKKYKINKNSDKLPYDPLQAMRFDINQNNILEQPCIICKSELNIEIHHVKRLKDTKDKSDIQKIMSKVNRKSVPLCRSCHNKVHAGKHDGKSLRQTVNKDKETK